MLPIQQPIVTRFAPSPTGYLHLGHVAHAMCVWRIAEKLGAQVLLRIEDHDRGRCRPEYEEAILRDLEWMGFTPHLGTLAEFRAGPCSFRQRDRREEYERMFMVLAAHADVYACSCSRKEILERTGQLPAEELWYDGYCRQLRLPFTDGVGIRVALPDRVLAFDDLLCGHQAHRPATQCGDLLLRDRHGNWTYQFSVVVDDMLQGINLVIRGMDLLDSTGRQLLLAEMLGRTQPITFAHHPLLLDEQGKKLSKRSFSTSIDQLRELGHTPEGILAQAKALVGEPWRALSLSQAD
jgi:glutamyl-tRNA synthetase/glutamyl-Q tRNA(Asp) synthetase